MASRKEERAEAAAREAADELSDVNRERKISEAERISKETSAGFYSPPAAAVHEQEERGTNTGVLGGIIKSVQGTLEHAKEVVTGKTHEAADVTREKTNESANKAKEMKDSAAAKADEKSRQATGKLEEYKDYTAEKAKETMEASSEKTRSAVDMATDKAKQAKDTTMGRVEEYKHYAADKATEAKDTAAGKAGEYKDYAADKAKQAKDATAETAGEYKDYAADKAKQAKDATAEKAGEYKDYAADKAKQAKDATVEKAGEYKDYAAEKATQAKDTTAEKAGEYKDYSAEKATQAKDTTAEKAKEGKDTTIDKLAELKDSAADAAKRTVGYLTGKKDKARQNVDVTSGQANKEKYELGEEAARRKMGELKLEAEGVKDEERQRAEADRETAAYRGQAAKVNIFSAIGNVTDAIKDKLTMPSDIKKETKAGQEYGGTKRPVDTYVVDVSKTPVGETASTMKKVDQITGQTTFNDVGKMDEQEGVGVIHLERSGDDARRRTR